MSSILAVAAASKVGKDVTSLLIKQMFTEALTTETIQMLLEDPNALIGAFDSPAVVRKFFSSTAFQTAFFLQPAAYRVRAISKLIGVEAVGPYDNMNQVGGDYRTVAAMVGLDPAAYTSWSNMVADPAALDAILGVSPTLVTFSTLAMDVVTASASAVAQVALSAEGRNLLLTNATLIAGIQANPDSLAALNAALLAVNTAADWTTWVANTEVFDPVLADTERFNALLSLPAFVTALSLDATAMEKVAVKTAVLQSLFANEPAMNIVASTAVARNALLGSATALPLLTDMAIGKLMIGVLSLNGLTPSDVSSWTAVLNDQKVFLAVLTDLTALQAVVATPLAFNTILNSTPCMNLLITSSNAMTGIITTPDAFTSMQANANAWAIFQTSTAVAWFTNPIMTSDTVPAGYIATASYYYDSGYLPFRAFDSTTSGGSISGSWWAPSGATGWIQLQCPNAVLPMSFTLILGDPSYRPTLARFLASVDGIVWDNLKEFVPSNQVVPLITSKKYKYFRLAGVTGNGWSLVDFRIKGIL